MLTLLTILLVLPLHSGGWDNCDQVCKEENTFSDFLESLEIKPTTIIMKKMGAFVENVNGEDSEIPVFYSFGMCKKFVNKLV
jgi:sulfur carrier protein ThiS